MQGRSGWKYEEIKAIHLWGGKFTEAHNLSHRTARNLFYKHICFSLFFAVTERASKHIFQLLFQYPVCILYWRMAAISMLHVDLIYDVSLLSLGFARVEGREGSWVCKMYARRHMHRGWSALKGPRAESRTRVGTSGASKIQTFIVSMSGNFVRLLLRAQLKKCIMCS